jgi:hypothetical protein
MSQDYKLRFDELNSIQQYPGGDEETLYAAPGNVRKLRFRWPDGETLSMNYAYLVNHHYNPSESTLSLTYTTATITIKGSGLNLLDDNLFNDIPKTIEVTESRYTQLGGLPTIVTEIVVERK